MYSAGGIEIPIGRMIAIVDADGALVRLDFLGDEGEGVVLPRSAFDIIHDDRPVKRATVRTYLRLSDSGASPRTTTGAKGENAMNMIKRDSTKGLVLAAGELGLAARRLQLRTRLTQKRAVAEDA